MSTLTRRMPRDAFERTLFRERIRDLTRAWTHVFAYVGTAPSPDGTYRLALAPREEVDLCESPILSVHGTIWLAERETCGRDYRCVVVVYFLPQQPGFQFDDLLVEDGTPPYVDWDSVRAAAQRTG